MRNCTSLGAEITTLFMLILQSIENHASAPIDFSRKRLQLGESLYYKTLEGIMAGEKKRIVTSNGTQQKIDFLVSYLIKCINNTVMHVNR